MLRQFAGMFGGKQFGNGEFGGRKFKDRFTVKVESEIFSRELHHSGIGAVAVFLRYCVIEPAVFRGTGVVEADHGRPFAVDVVLKGAAAEILKLIHIVQCGTYADPRQSRE